MVEVLYFAEFKMITGKKTERFLLQKEKNVKELIELLIKQYPKLRNILISADTTTLNDSISIAINHSIKNVKNPLSLSLNENDIVAFLLPVSGG
ncbi:MAG: ThiS family protein [Promethearchaeota archaeon]|nr:MAG: ThiS family protein [Candidatus Lokiarchaeota archaeon]